VSVLAGDALCDGHALLLGFVRQHRTPHDVADGPDPFEIRAALLVDNDESALVELEPDALHIQPRRVRHTAYGND